MSDQDGAANGDPAQLNPAEIASAGGDAPTTTPPQNAAEPPAGSGFQGLDVEKKRRVAAAARGMAYGAAALAVLVIAAVVWVSLQSGTGMQGTGPKNVDTPAQAVLNCDNPADYQGNDAHPCTLRNRFQSTYQLFSVDRLPPLQAASGEAFVAEALASIEQHEENAIAAFDRSNFTQAVEAVDKAIAEADALSAAIQRAYDYAFREAATAFENNHAPAASEWIATALRLDNTRAEAQALAGRIAVLPQVLDLMTRADAAEVQNLDETLFDLWGEIVRLDPARHDIAARQRNLGAVLREARHQSFLRSATAALEAGDTAAAREALQKARRIFSDRDDSASLMRVVEELEKANRIKALFADARAAQAADNWGAAAEIYTQILAEDASDQTAITGRDQARKIIAATARVTGIIEQQHRLQDAAVYQQAVDIADHVRPLAQHSRALQSQLDTLDTVLTRWRQSMPVLVVSDGKSTIWVRRTGQVGETRQKEIQLKPGRYEFECKREGYRSKIVEHFVPVDADITSVTIACDVPL